jgi:hypothetical protein
MFTPCRHEFSRGWEGHPALRETWPTWEFALPGSVFLLSQRAASPKFAPRSQTGGGLARWPGAFCANRDSIPHTAAPELTVQGCVCESSAPCAGVQSRRGACRVLANSAADLNADHAVKMALAIPAPIVPRRAPGAQTTQPRSSRLIRRHHTASTDNKTKKTLKSVRQPTVSMLRSVISELQVDNWKPELDFPEDISLGRKPFSRTNQRILCRDRRAFANTRRLASPRQKRGSHCGGRITAAVMVAPSTSSHLARLLPETHRVLDVFIVNSCSARCKGDLRGKM